MADIISGGSRFTGDKKAPVRKVIKLNTDSSIGNNINNYDDRNIGQAAVTKEADYEEIRQASSFDVRYGGSEANVALSLANLGADASFFTIVPDNSLGKSAIQMLKMNNEIVNL